MSISTTSTIKSGIEFVQKDSQSLTTLTDLGNVLMDENLSSGSGIQECNLIFHDIITLPSGSSTTINLRSLTKTVFEKDVTVGFENIKSLVIKNNSENSNEFISISVSGSNSFTDPFNGVTTSVIKIYPKCSITLSNILAGWNISSSNANIQINDLSGSGVEVALCAVGVSGSG